MFLAVLAPLLQCPRENQGRFGMRKLFWIAILILILVCINWLRQAKAQTTQEQLHSYSQLRSGTTPPTGPVTAYQTPAIFDPQGHKAVDSTPALGASASGDQPAAATADSHQLVLPTSTAIERFGQHLFDNPQVGEINTAVVPEGYLLGPGDNLIVSLWGRVQQEWNLTVDREGKVFIPKAGEITAWGMTLGEFGDRLDAQLSKVYSEYKRKITLGKIRTIKVFVYGEVKAPGGYAVSALATLFNALYAAGGPSDHGSLRQIKLLRNNQSTAIDLYDFLIAGDKRCDLPLQSGDVVFVPLAGAQVTIRGEVKRPALYELAGGETIVDLMTLAGGVTAEAYLRRLMLDRISDNDARKLVDLDYTRAETKQLPLADGDDLSVFSIYQMRQNVIWINGMVKHPGTFERSDGMRIGDLVDKGQLLPSNVYRERADLYRRHSDGRVEILAVNLDRVLAGDSAANLCLEDLDSLHIYNTSDVERKEYVYIDGMVQKPGQYLLYDHMTVSDLVFLAGNLLENAYMLGAELARIDSLGATAVRQVPLDRPEGGLALPLRENDRLFVRRIPGYQLHRMVTIEGEVCFPGRYSLTHRDETLWELIDRAGGFTPKAFPTGAVFTRKGIVGDLQRINIGGIVHNSLPLIADSTGTFKPVETISLEEKNMDRIIIDMQRLIASNGQEGDFGLQSGDQIYIPEIPSGIAVLGEVCANGTIKYEPGKKVKYYLEQAGGFTRRADKGHVQLVKANGRVYASGGMLPRKADLGDVIIVPSQIKKERDWLKYVATTASVLTGVATSLLIIDRL